MATKPGYTQTLTVTDAAQVNVTASTFCAALYVSESSVAAGWPRTFLVKGPMPGSVQIAQTPGASFRFPGPFQPGDIVGSVELNPASGDTSIFNIAELSA
jgi:hypothetical protein